MLAVPSVWLYRKNQLVRNILSDAAKLVVMTIRPPKRYNLYFNNKGLQLTLFRLGGGGQSSYTDCGRLNFVTCKQKPHNFATFPKNFREQATMTC